MSKRAEKQCKSYLRINLGGARCTLRRGHIGKHEAYAGDRFGLLRWPQESSREVKKSWKALSPHYSPKTQGGVSLSTAVKRLMAWHQNVLTDNFEAAKVLGARGENVAIAATQVMERLLLTELELREANRTIAELRSMADDRGRELADAREELPLEMRSFASVPAAVNALMKAIRKDKATLAKIREQIPEDIENTNKRLDEMVTALRSRLDSRTWVQDQVLEALDNPACGAVLGVRYAMERIAQLESESESEPESESAVDVRAVTVALDRGTVTEGLSPRRLVQVLAKQHSDLRSTVMHARRMVDPANEHHEKLLGPLVRDRVMELRSEVDQQERLLRSIALALGVEGVDDVRTEVGRLVSKNQRMSEALNEWVTL